MADHHREVDSMRGRGTSIVSALCSEAMLYGKAPTGILHETLDKPHAGSMRFPPGTFIGKELGLASGRPLLRSRWLGRRRGSGARRGSRHRDTVATGCITLFTTYSPISSPMPVPTRVEKR